jgi:hypothetical protein
MKNELQVEVLIPFDTTRSSNQPTTSIFECRLHSEKAALPCSMLRNIRTAGLCHGSGGYPPATHHGGPGSHLDQFTWDLWWTK